MVAGRILLGAVVSALWPAVALAQTPAPAAVPTTPGDGRSDLESRLRALEESNQRLREEIEDIKQDHKFTEGKVGILQGRTRVSGYIDVGAFHVEGNGSGIRPDVGNIHFPQYANAIPGGSWVFMGDVLATAINSRGDIPDTGGSRAIQFNPIANGGAASFIINTATVFLSQGIGDDVLVNVGVDFLPRGRNISDSAGVDLGDYIDAKLAYAEWRVPTRGWDLSLFAGKFDSVLGIEYRTQESTDRIGIAPSLICRYTCGHPVGLKARAQFFEQRLGVAVEVIDGSNQVEYFPFYDEVDPHDMKTVAGRLSYKFPIAGQGLELGVSGSYGPQALQVSNSIAQWHFGADAKLEYKDLDVRAEWVTGKAEGKTSPTMEAQGIECDQVPCLRYMGAYGQIGYRLTNWLMPYVRVDGRDALHQNGANFIYVSQLVRATPGVRMEFGPAVIVKAEYTIIHELGPIPQFPDNVATSSLVVKY